MPKFRLVVTCEHGGNRIPKSLAAHFSKASGALQSHCGYDSGAAKLAKKIAEAFSAPLHVQRISRLLIDNNRSLHHPRLFSEFSRGLPLDEKRALVERYYMPHRMQVEHDIKQLQKRRPVLHLAVHSFTPVLGGEMRTADLGLLYDPKRSAEAAFSRALLGLLKQELPQQRIRANYPYRGAADGFTTYLRRQFPVNYIGIELEVNQKHVATPAWAEISNAMITALDRLISQAR